MKARTYTQEGRPIYHADSVTTNVTPVVRDRIEAIEYVTALASKPGVRISGGLVLMDDNSTAVEVITFGNSAFTGTHFGLHHDRINFVDAETSGCAYIDLAEQSALIVQKNDDENDTVGVVTGFSDFAQEVIRIIPKEYIENE